MNELKMINDEQEKSYFVPGDLVKVRHNIDNIPTMFVVEKVTKSLINKTDNSSESVFLGIRTRWFDKNLVLREAIFSTKDLVHV